MPTSLILLTVSGRATQILPKNNNKPIEEMMYIGIDIATGKLELTPLVRAIAERNKTYDIKVKIEFKITKCQYSFLVDFPLKSKGLFQADI